MKILVLGDCHLKPVMFDKADEILASGQADIAIQMGDLVDDWGEESNIGLYERTLKRAIKFNEEHPGTLWCLGNHCQGYRATSYGPRESGHSKTAEPFVTPLLKQLPQKVIHIVDDVIFTHAGLTKDWVNRQKMLVGLTPNEPLDKGGLEILANFAAPAELWQENGPIWVRPQDDEYEMWPAKLQVVGHTPVRTCTEQNGVLSTDTWSTYSNGASYGDRSFAVVDTETGEWDHIKQYLS